MRDRRKVTPVTRTQAIRTIKIVAEAMLSGERAVTYSELARRLGMPNETGQGLGPTLNETAELCKEFRLPDVTSVIVTKESLDHGRPFPSLRSFQDGVWPITGMTVDQVPAEQDRVRAYDWRSVASLKLK